MDSQMDSTAKGASNISVKLLLTIPETAKALGLGRSIVYELLLAGEIPSIKIGRARRVPIAALEQFVLRQLTGQYRV